MSNEILIIDDEADIRNLVAGLLEDEGYQTREAGNSTEALSEIEFRRPNLVLLDIWLHGSELDGLGILQEIKKTHPLLPVSDFLLPHPIRLHIFLNRTDESQRTRWKIL